MTIKDIAKLSGYSIGTVSRVINDHPDVSPEARAKIQEIIRRENFQPNRNAKHLKQVRSSAVTIIVKGTSNLFLNTLLEKTQRYLISSGEDANVVFVAEEENEVRHAVQICSERNPKGIIFLGGALENFRSDFAEIRIPCVLISGWAEDLGFDNLSSFCTDDYEGGRMAMEQLIERGHKNVLIVGGFLSDEDEQVSSKRLQGAVSVLHEHSIDFSLETGYAECPFSMEGGYEKTLPIIEVSPDITGIFALSDMIAIGVMRAIRDLGKKVPEDISVIGFDGITYASYTVPRLTTVSQDITRLAEEGVNDLLFRISYKRNTVHKRISCEISDSESIAQTK